MRIIIDFDPNTNAVGVQGIPMATLSTGEQVVLSGICYAALERARDAIKDMKPGEKDSILLAQGTIPPPVNRLNGHG